MSWLYSQALVEEFSRASCSETGPSAPSSSTPMPQAYSCDDRTMDTYRRSRFGTTCAPLTADHGAALLTWYLAGFPVRTSALPAAATDSKASAVDSGGRWRAWFARLNLSTSEWKTAQCSLLGDSASFSGTWPRSGSMRSGTCYPRPTLAPGICVSESGSLLPTLTVCGNYNAKGASKTSGDGLATALAKGLLPTLVADDTGMRKKNYAQGGMPLSLAVQRLPTLLACDATKPRRGPNSIAKGGGPHIRDVLDPGRELGPLNPDWCEWFMGFPIGWTASSALETPRFHEWRQQHSPLSQQSLEAA